MALGVDAGGGLSPALLEKAVYIGVLMKSFPQGATAIGKLLDVPIGRKRLERLTEGIGAERVAEREAECAQVKSLTLTEKCAGLDEPATPRAVAVMADGGRAQLDQRNEDSKTHWHEYKAGICLSLKGAEQDADPCPQLPEFLRNLEYVETLTREIGQKAAEASAPAPEAERDLEAEPAETVAQTPAELVAEMAADTAVAAAASLAKDPPSRWARGLPLSPEVVSREVVATFEKIRRFEVLLVARARQFGLFEAARRGFVGDGQNWIWSMFDTHFKPFGFVGVLDIIHAVTYLYAAATAGRDKRKGGRIYGDWMTWTWQGEISRVIAALAERQNELGLPQDADGATHPRRIVSEALTYLQNQQSRMDYPRYRQLGLPLTTSRMESTIKELNQRIKGSEKFWSKPGGEAVLQLKADTLCDSQPLDQFWKNRQQTRTGLHASANSKTPRQAA